MTAAVSRDRGRGSCSEQARTPAFIISTQLADIPLSI